LVAVDAQHGRGAGGRRLPGHRRDGHRDEGEPGPHPGLRGLRAERPGQLGPVELDVRVEGLLGGGAAGCGVAAQDLRRIDADDIARAIEGDRAGDRGRAAGIVAEWDAHLGARPQAGGRGAHRRGHPGQRVRHELVGLQLHLPDLVLLRLGQGQDEHVADMLGQGGQARAAQLVEVFVVGHQLLPTATATTSSAPALRIRSAAQPACEALSTPRSVRTPVPSSTIRTVAAPMGSTVTRSAAGRVTRSARVR
jgi:hypothetical protein